MLDKFMKGCLLSLISVGFATAFMCGYLATETVVDDIDTGVAYLAAMLLALGLSLTMSIAYVVGFCFLSTTDQVGG